MRRIPAIVKGISVFFIVIGVKKWSILLIYDNIMRYGKERSIDRSAHPVQLLKIERLQSVKQTDFKYFRLRVPADQ